MSGAAISNVPGAWSVKNYLDGQVEALCDTLQAALQILAIHFIAILVMIYSWS